MESWGAFEATCFVRTVLGADVKIDQSVSGKWLATASAELLSSWYGNRGHTLLLAIEAHKTLTFAESCQKFGQEREKENFKKFYHHVGMGGRASGAAFSENPLEISWADSEGLELTTDTNYDPEWRDHVESGLSSILAKLRECSQQDEAILCRVFNEILAQKLATQVKVGSSNAMDAVVGGTLVELKIGNDMRKASVQLAVYEAQRLGLNDPAKRSKFRVRDTYCVYAPKGFGLTQTRPVFDITLRKVRLHFLEDRGPIATVFRPINFFLTNKGGAIDIDEAWKMRCVFDTAHPFLGDPDSDEEMVD
eukprot:Gregarina_sp_Poly_1__5653@NODE_2980_length_1485_cov_43_412553_g1881_i0_p1_GENE_NODE_2980_length_1485_cov_43_412553_g1881_i0NODE_2980_length_1485_cov_43_412553_g1881_i0_p1_ORF_typecomplete_len307_score21_16_NODE_2980_length_1485_cov_43_412553_g1881_i04751395